MAAHSSILAWVIPWTEEPDGSHGVTEYRTRLNTHTHTEERFGLDTLCSLFYFVYWLLSVFLSVGLHMGRNLCLVC